jgi:hypothetical protein
MVHLILLAPTEGTGSDGNEVQFVHIPTGVLLNTHVPALGTWAEHVTFCKQLIEESPEHVPAVSMQVILVL